MLVVGLTGGIASGKSAASDCFASLGVPIIDADIAARQVVEPHSPALEKIKHHFGEEVITPSGELDRKSLRAKIFSADAERRWLEELLHPLIRARIVDDLEQEKIHSPYSILVSPLLLETDQHSLVDRILVVDVPETLQLSRTMARDGSNAVQARAIIAAQMSRSERLKKADDVITNDADIGQLQREVAKLHEIYLQLATGQ